MKSKLIWSGLAAAVLATTSLAAQAADLPARAPAPVYTKAPPAVAAFSWTGAYIGGSVGGRWSTYDAAVLTVAGVPPVVGTTVGPASAKTSTLRAGIYGGYNFQVAPTWLVGIEGDFAWGRGSATIAPLPGTLIAGTGTNATVEDRWDASARARLGFLVSPTWLIYATGGAAWQRVNVATVCTATGCAAAATDTASATRSGWTVGGGIEGALTSNWLLRGEYRYSDYGTWTNTFFSAVAADTTVATIRLRTNTALVGLAYKF